MECLIIIKHWNEDGEPYKDSRLYDKRGQALGFGQIKVADTKEYNKTDTDTSKYINPCCGKRVCECKPKCKRDYINDFLKKKC